MQHDIDPEDVWRNSERYVWDWWEGGPHSEDPEIVLAQVSRLMLSCHILRRRFRVTWDRGELLVEVAVGR